MAPISSICAKVVVSHAAKTNASTGFGQVLQATMNQKLQEAAAAPIQEPQKASPVQRIITSMSRSEDRLRELVEKSLSGKVEYSPEKLLVWQDSVYKATFVIDVAAKSVEQATSGFKTLMQSQI